jgi:hypothetical protein
VTAAHEGNANLLFGFQVLISKEDNPTGQARKFCLLLIKPESLFYLTTLGCH